MNKELVIIHLQNVDDDDKEALKEFLLSYQIKFNCCNYSEIDSDAESVLYD